MKVTEIVNNLKLFNQTFVEVRMIHTSKGTISGYYDTDHFDKLVRDLRSYDGTYNIFFTLNELDENIVARSLNRLNQWSKHTTTDAEITRRKWVLIDLDPVRPSGVSSTNEELHKAEELADKVLSFLDEEGFPEAVHAMSGNGHHILLPADLPNEPEITKLIKKFLLVLDSMFSTAEVKVDVTTYNAARITKLYGTVACKGDDTKDRPHRQSYIISVPDSLEPVSMELLETVISESEKSHEKIFRKDKPSKKVKKSSKKVDVRRFCQNHGIKISHEKPCDNDGTCYVLSTCPWNAEHNDKSAYIIEFPNGKIVAGCHHDSCSEETWETLLKKFPDTSDQILSSCDDEDGKMSRAEILLRNVQEAGHLLFHDNSEIAYVSVPLANEQGEEYLKLRDKRYAQILRQMFYEIHDKPLSKENIQQAIDTLEAIAIFKGEIIEPVLRCKFCEDELYYHLADEESTVLCINAEGVYVLDECPIAFINPKVV